MRGVEHGRDFAKSDTGIGNTVAKRFAAAAVLLILVFLAASLPAQSPAQSAAALPLEDRAMVASQIHHIVSTFFPGLSQAKFDTSYAAYLRTILQTSDRREFDLASMQFVAGLHDGRDPVLHKAIELAQYR